MKHWLEIIRLEWELAAFWCCLTMFCLVVLFRILGFGDHSQQTTTRDSVKRHGSLMTAESFAFLDMPEAAELEKDSPFFKSLVASRKRPWAGILDEIRNPKPAPSPPKPATKPDEKPALVVTTTPDPGVSQPPAEPAVVVTTVPEAPKPPPDPAVERRRLEEEQRRLLAATRIVTYLGSATTGSGVRAAYVQVQNAATKETQLRFLTQDDALGDVKVVAFDAEALEVAKGDGTVQRIAFGTAERIVLEH